MSSSQNRGAGKGIVVQLGALSRAQRFIFRLVQTCKQQPARLLLHSVHDRRDLIDGLALAKERLIQADPRSAIKIDFEFWRHAGKRTKALPLRYGSNDKSSVGASPAKIRSASARTSSLRLP